MLMVADFFNILMLLTPRGKHDFSFYHIIPMLIPALFQHTSTLPQAPVSTEAENPMVFHNSRGEQGKLVDWRRCHYAREATYNAKMAYREVECGVQGEEE